MNPGGRRSKVVIDAKKPASSTRRREKAPPPANQDTQDETLIVEDVRGFTIAEIRRFIKSYRKFGHPKSRSVCSLQSNTCRDYIAQRRSDKRAAIKTFLSCDQYKTCGFNVADSAFYNVLTCYIV